MSTTAPGAPQLLKDAKYIAGRNDAMPIATWGRAVAVLARQSMEQALDDLWAVLEPSMSGQRNKRASFLCLVTYLPAGQAADAYYSWRVLSRACHFQSYDVEPSAFEVEEWLAGAERFLVAVAAALSAGSQPIEAQVR